MRPEYLSAEELFELFPELETKLKMTKARLAAYLQTGAIDGEIDRNKNKIFYDVESVFAFLDYINGRLIRKTIDIQELERRWKK